MHLNHISTFIQQLKSNDYIYIWRCRVKCTCNGSDLRRVPLTLWHVNQLSSQGRTFSFRVPRCVHPPKHHSKAAYIMYVASLWITHTYGMPFVTKLPNVCSDHISLQGQHVSQCGHCVSLYYLQGTHWLFPLPQWTSLMKPLPYFQGLGYFDTMWNPVYEKCGKVVWITVQIMFLSDVGRRC